MDETLHRAELALLAAQQYYLGEQTMTAIGNSLHMSRSSVSRLLSYARERGLVDIRIRRPDGAVSHLQREIRLREGVAAYVIPVSKEATRRERDELVARQAGRIVSAMVAPGTVIGVAWEATVARLSRHLADRPLEGVSVVQLNGAAHPFHVGSAYFGDVLGRFAAAFDARVVPLAVPAIFDDATTRAAVWRERAVARTLHAQRGMDICIFGVGDPFATVSELSRGSGWLSPSDRSGLEESHVVGEVAAMFFRIDGSHDGIELNRRTSGPGIDILRIAPRRVCVVSESSRLRALRGALAAGLVTDLIIDDLAAAEFLRLYRDLG